MISAVMHSGHRHLVRFTRGLAVLGIFSLLAIAVGGENAVAEEHGRRFRVPPQTMITGKIHNIEGKKQTEGIQVFIKDVSIDYKPWEKAHANLKLDRQDALKRYERDLNYYDLATKRVRGASNAYIDATRKMNEKRLEFRKAEQDAESKDIDEDKKSPEYKLVEARRDEIRRRLGIIDQRIAYLRQNPGPGSARAMLGLLDENDSLENELGHRSGRLKTLRSELGIEKDLAAAKARVKQLDLEYLDLQKAVKRAETDLAVAEGLHEDASADYFQAEAAYQKVAAAFDKLSKTGSPLITGIKSLDFHATYWVPEKELTEIAGTINILGNHLRRLDLTRKRYRSEFNDAVFEATFAAEKLNDAIYQSAISQWLVESGFFIYDVANAASKGGPYAAGAAIIKKGIEIAIFPPSYYDATLSVSDAALATVAGIPKTGLKRGVKTLTTGHGAKVMIEQLLKEQGKANLDKLWSAFTRESWFDEAMRRVDPDLYSQMTQAIQKLVSDQTKQLEASEKAFASLVGKQGFGTLAKSVGKSFLKGLAKDLAKEAIKKAAAEFFEGRAFLSYLRHQGYLSASSQQLLRASSMYWISKDIFKFQVALRDALLAQYDPDAQLKIESNRKFVPKSRYEFRLIDNYGDAYDLTNRDISIKLGGIKLERHSETLVFLLPEGAGKKLTKDEKGGVTLAIDVLR